MTDGERGRPDNQSIFPFTPLASTRCLQRSNVFIMCFTTILSVIPWRVTHRHGLHGGICEG